MCWSIDIEKRFTKYIHICSVWDCVYPLIFSLLCHTVSGFVDNSALVQKKLEALKLACPFWPLCRNWISHLKYQRNSECDLYFWVDTFTVFISPRCLWPVEYGGRLQFAWTSTWQSWFEWSTEHWNRMIELLYYYYESLFTKNWREWILDEIVNTEYNSPIIGLVNWSISQLILLHQSP